MVAVQLEASEPAQCPLCEGVDRGPCAPSDAAAASGAAAPAVGPGGTNPAATPARPLPEERPAAVSLAPTAAASAGGRRTSACCPGPPVAPAAPAARGPGAPPVVAHVVREAPAAPGPQGRGPACSLSPAGGCGESPHASAPLTVFVQTVYKTITCSVKIFDTVAALHVTIFERLGLDPAEYYLRLGAKCLDDGRTFESCNASNETTVILYFIAPGGVNRKRQAAQVWTGSNPPRVREAVVDCR